MAVRHLKRYVSWVQTVQFVIVNRKVDSLNPSDIEETRDTTKHGGREK